MQGKKYKTKKYSNGGKVTGKDIYGNPIIANVRKDSKVNRSYYDDRLNNMVLGSDYNSLPTEVKNKVEAHENYHAKQYISGNSNFDIAHNTNNAVASRLRKKPSVVATDEEYYDYHNRKPIESKLDIENFRANNKKSEFIPSDVIFDKRIDESQYNNPNSFEGEASYYENTGKDFPKYSKGNKSIEMKYKTKKCFKGAKKVKIQKAEEGIQKVDLTQFGGLAGGAGALGIEALTQSNANGRYTSQLKDENQAIGRGIGAGVGMGLNMIAPGLGSLATPILSSVGGAIQRGLQKDKLKEIETKEKLADSIEKSNSGIRTDLTSFQAKQYTKGSKKVKAPSMSTASETTDTANMPKTKVPTEAQEAYQEYKKFDARNGSIKPAESDGIKTARKALRAIDGAATLGQAGNFIPNPIAQTIGKVSSAVGVGTGLAQAGLDAYSGDYKSAGMNLIGAGLSGAVGKLAGKSFNKIPGVVNLSKSKPLKGSYTPLKNNKLLGAAFGVEAGTNLYSKGSSKLKTKVIEIEGKGTPEIHTDKNFNIKNLGTVPHSKGGNKVLAEEGDIVFPTQNSKKKYNEVMTAIMKKDKYKLKKEQNKLPEDKANKYKEGSKKIWLDGKQVLMTDEEVKEYKANQKNTALKTLSNLKSNSGASLYGQPDKPLNLSLPSTSTKVSNENKGTANTTRAKEIAQSSTNKSGGKVSGNSQIQALNDANGVPMYFDDVNRNQQYNANVDWNAPGAKDLSAHDPSNPYAKNNLPVRAIPIAGGKTRYYQNPTPVEHMQTKNSLNYDLGSTPEMIKSVSTASSPEIPVDKDKPKKSGAGLNTGLFEYAPTAYNLAQGLFGNVEKVKRREYNPKLEDYVDTSSNMRREINQGYKANVGNARNLSGGLASNMRSNSQSAVNNKIAQVNSVDSQEYGKQLDVNNRNVGRINEGRQINFNAQNVYDDLDAQNRAKKSEALATGLTSIGDIAGRDKLYKHNLQAKLIEGNAIQGAYNYGNGISTDSTQITGLNTDFRQGSGIPTNQYSSLDITKKPKKQSKGNKSIQVERRYKLKK